MVDDEQTSETGQPFPPMPRHPGVQREAAVSQTRPDVMLPQSASVVQPHWPLDRHCPPARLGSQAPAIAGVHSVQVWRAGSHSSELGQSASTRHSTQRPVVAARSQRGSGLAQSMSRVQPVGDVHWPAPFTTLVHIKLDGQSLRGDRPQPGVQIPFGPLQISPDIGPPHSGSDCGPAQPHRPVSGRHSGLMPPQRLALVPEHSVQAPASGPEIWQAGREGLGQFVPPSAVHGPQVCVVVEQTGVTPPQSLASRHPTQAPTPVDVSQSGREVGHFVVLLAVQAPQAPFGWQTGVAPPHSASVTQPRQVPVATEQTGVVPLQAETFVAEQAPQAPLGWQTGVAPLHSPSPVQPWQVPATSLQTGVVPLHCALVTQVTQVPLVGLQTGVLPPHRLALLAEQTPQAPLGWQAGVLPPQSASAVQPRQLPALVLHTGVVPLHWALLTHVTQVPVLVLQVDAPPMHFDVLVAEQLPQAPLG